jgi:exodeoxyribonuclease X
MSGAQWTELDYMVVDVEGNGDWPPRLVEVAVVPVGGGIVGKPRSWLIRPATPITWQARRVHGITNEAVEALPGIDAIRADLVDQLADHVIVGHNVRIDVDVLTRELPGWKPAATLDTLRLARQDLPGRSSYRLGTLVDDFQLAAGLSNDLQPHRATYDAVVTARLLNRLAGDKSVRDLRELGALSEAESDDAELRLFD